MKPATLAAAILLCFAARGLAQTTQPSTQPPAATESGGGLKSQSADQVFNQMLKPAATNPSRPLEPVADKPVTDKASGPGTVGPAAPRVNVIREGTFIFDRTARLTHAQNGESELTFESDGKALRDPPMLILPNLKLQQMEDQVTAASRDLKFRVSGMVTEYHGRNYVLIERVVALDPALQF